jgi:hypothetical protein
MLNINVHYCTLECDVWNLCFMFQEGLSYIPLMSLLAYVHSDKKLRGLSPPANSTARAKSMPTLTDRGCRLVSVTDPYAVFSVF